MENKITKSLVIIGGGPAGLAAAVAAAENGLPAEDILILERDGRLGGILNQCIHNGFGLHTFKEELTGPEYAARFEERAKALHIPYKLGAMVLSISPEKVVTAVSREDGLFTVEAGAVILAMGCRERPRGALNIPGYRPAGIYSAGTAQRLVNLEGFMPGREVVILGSGDIGLIMARRMTLEGAKVHVVAELQPYSGGLKRNIVQCLDDFGIPLKLSHTVTEIHGKDRVTGVTISAVDDKLKPIPGTEEYYSCDTLLLSAGNRHTALAKNGAVALFELCDIVMDIGHHRRILNGLLVFVIKGEGNIAGNRVGEQEVVLRHVGAGVAHRMDGHGVHVLPVHKQRALPQAEQQLKTALGGGHGVQAFQLGPQKIIDQRQPGLPCGHPHRHPGAAR